MASAGIGTNRFPHGRKANQCDMQRLPALATFRELVNTDEQVPNQAILKLDSSDSRRDDDRVHPFEAGR